MAAENGHGAVVRLLLEAQVDVDVKDEYGGTVLHRTAVNGHEAVVPQLLEAKADVNAKTESGRRALH
jgi:ankyrin repeat protein